MKLKTRHAAELFALLTLAIGGVSSPAQPTNLMVYNFDTDQVTPIWSTWFGGYVQNYGWDPTTDASNNPNSGSMELILNCTGSDQYAFWDSGTPQQYSPVDLTTFTNISFDMRYDGSSAIRTNADGSLDFGYMRIGSRNPSYDQDWYYYFAVPATNGLGQPNTNWVHISADLTQVPIEFSDLSDGLLDTVIGMDGSAYGNSVLVGPQTIWFDNIQYNGYLAPVPPPTLALRKTTPALRLFGGNGRYGRSQLALVDTSESWVGGTFPVTYSFTALDNATSPGNLDTHIHFIQNSDEYSGADYTSPNTLWLQIISGSGTNTACVANVSWKTNAPGSNPDDHNVALRITNSVLAGTWTLTFNSDTNGTLTAPGASPVPFTLGLSDADVIANFGNPVQVRFGIMNYGNTANGGVPHDWANISVSGTPGTQINEDFTKSSTTQLDTNIWDLGTSDGNGLQVLVPTNAAYWVTWPIPDTGFSLINGTSLAGGPLHWTDAASLTPVLAAGVKWALIPDSSLPTGDVNYYALIKRPFSQLQILLPGETNAPNTLTGKIGTPDTIYPGSYVNVTINAVDSNWHIVNVSGDSIALTSSDIANDIMPLDAPLANGTLTQTVLFDAYLTSPGDRTLTATDTTDTNIIPATVTVTVAQ